MNANNNNFWNNGIVKSIVNSGSDQLVDLVKLTGLPIRDFFKFADFQGADLCGQDLREFDLRMAKFSGAMVDDGTLVDGGVPITDPKDITDRIRSVLFSSSPEVEAGGIQYVLSKALNSGRMFISIRDKYSNWAGNLYRISEWSTQRVGLYKRPSGRNVLLLDHMGPYVPIFKIVFGAMRSIIDEEEGIPEIVKRHLINKFGNIDEISIDINIIESIINELKSIFDVKTIYIVLHSSSASDYEIDQIVSLRNICPEVGYIVGTYYFLDGSFDWKGVFNSRSMKFVNIDGFNVENVGRDLDIMLNKLKGMVNLTRPARTFLKDSCVELDQAVFAISGAVDVALSVQGLLPINLGKKEIMESSFG